MKKFILTTFFAMSHLFMPFIYVNCGGQIIDDPYNVSEDDDGANASETLAAECESHTFLTKDCVEYEKAKMAEEAED